MTDDAIQPAETEENKPAVEPGAPTPEELLAETQDNDPEVGIDGIGMGELP